MRQFEQMVGRRCRQRLPPDLAGVDRVEAPPEVADNRLIDLTTVHRRTVGCDRDQHIVFAEIVIARCFNRREQVAQRRQAEVGQTLHQPGVDAASLNEVLASFGGIEQHQQLVGMAVADRGDHIGIHDVVDVRDVLVTDALDVMFAKAVVEQGRTFGRFDRDDARAEHRFQVIAGSQRATGTGSRNIGGELGSGLAFRQRIEQCFQRGTGAVAVDQVVSELAELVEDNVGRITV